MKLEELHVHQLSMDVGEIVCVKVRKWKVFL